MSSPESAQTACRCGCIDTAGAATHAVIEALARDDTDAAIERGLLDDVHCTHCTPDCRATLVQARDARRTALAARARYRAREARLQRRAQERARQRAAAPIVETTAAPAPAGLPSAAAAALARAREKAAQRHKP